MPLTKQFAGRKVHELLEKPEHWCQRHIFMRDGVATVQSMATQCCLLGALSICGSPHETYITLRKVAYKRGYAGIADLNDRSDHADVLALCKELDI